jgi:hypothetical protein
MRSIAENTADLDSEHEALLDKWEADLRRREEELRQRRDDEGEADGPDQTPA